MITETKLEDSFSIMQFNIEGYYYTFSLDRNEYGAVFYYNARRHSIYINSNEKLYHFFIELNLRKKWLLCFTNNPNRSFISDYFSIIGNKIFY